MACKEVKKFEGLKIPSALTRFTEDPEKLRHALCNKVNYDWDKDCDDDNVKCEECLLKKEHLGAFVKWLRPALLRESSEDVTIKK